MCGLIILQSLERKFDQILISVGTQLVQGQGTLAENVPEIVLRRKRWFFWRNLKIFSRSQKCLKSVSSLSSNVYQFFLLSFAKFIRKKSCFLPARCSHRSRCLSMYQSPQFKASAIIFNLFSLSFEKRCKMIIEFWAIPTTNVFPYILRHFSLGDYL